MFIDALPKSLGPESPPAPIFTVASALRWLGHDCVAGRCSEGIDTLTATVWLLSSAEQLLYPLESLILVEPVADGEVPPGLLDVLGRVNCCTRGDAISIRRRPPALGDDELIAAAAIRRRSIRDAALTP